ncbi:MAG TPA: histidine phosphatase family protein [Solirubrobacteraceae bacterium]
MSTRSVLVLALTTVAAVGGCESGSDDDDARRERPREARAPSGDAPISVVGRLRDGGHVLVFRHAATDFSMTDETRDLRDCARQRNLNAQGRRQARAIGSALRRLGIPVGDVLASPYCRTRDTARLAFGRVRSSTALLSADFFRSPSARAGQPRRLRRLLAARPRAGTNTVLVSHGFAIDDATGVSLAEGEAAVVAPSVRARDVEVVARIEADEWARLARRSRPPRVQLREYRVFEGAGPHDVAPARDGTVWFTAQAAGELGRLDPRTGRIRRVRLGAGSAPHGVIVGPDRAAWVTDGGLNAIVRVDDRSLRVRRFPLPRDRPAANLNTATFDRRGRLWFTGQAGIYGRLDPRSGRMRVFDAPRGPDPYGIATTPEGDVWYASLAGSHVARIDTRSGRPRVVEPPTRGQGARRVWSDSQGRIWVSEWNAGKVAAYDPSTNRWREWRLPGDEPQPYAIYVDDADLVWLTDFGANAFVRFDPASERFETFRLRSAGANVRQLLGRGGQVWGAESGTDRLVVAKAP